MGMRVVLKSNLFISKYIALNFYLCFILSELFLQYPMVSLQILYGGNGRLYRSVAQVSVVIVITLNRTDDLSSPTGQLYAMLK